MPDGSASSETTFRSGKDNNTAKKRKGASAAGNSQSQQNKVTSSSQSESGGDVKSSSSEALSAKRQKTGSVQNQPNSVLPHQASLAPFGSITSSSQQQYPYNALSSYNLKLANNKQRTSASYYINEDDMIMIEDVMMCPYMFRTNNAVVCGALADCVVPGMLRVQFSSNNKLASMEMIYDAMGFMQQLDGANGGNITAQVIPGSLEMALMHCAHEARVITEAKAPYNILHVNEAFTALTQYSQLEVEAKSLLPLMEGRVDAAKTGAVPTAASVDKSSCVLQEAAKGRPGCVTSVHFRKDSKRFVDFMCSYPLTNAQDEITHLLHVSMELPKDGTYIP
ncbi:MAG: hypothetical protein SGARI_002740 [Bacillariaceae sp.]